MQATEKALGAELDKQRRRVAAVHVRLSGQAATCLAGIATTKPGMSLFVQHCILPRVTYSAEVCLRVNADARCCQVFILSAHPGIRNETLTVSCQAVVH